MRGLAAVAASALLLAFTGCGRKATVTPPEVRLPPEVEAVYPEARSTGVAYETEIWARFVQALDSATVTSRNVTLRQDAHLIPVEARWESATRRVRIRPLAVLGAGRTHTVTLGTGLASVDGARLGQEFSWQFRTQAVKRPEHPNPADGTVEESPFVTLSWDSVQAGFGTIVYDFYSGGDSARVAERLDPPARLDRPYYLPRRRWNLETRFYWAVTAINLSTSEYVSGPVWRFETLRRDTPIDSVLIPLSAWGHYDAVLNEQVCFLPSFTSGGNQYKAAFRWDLRSLGPRKLARAAAELVDVPGTRLIPLEVFSSLDYWPACDIRVDGAPHVDPQGLLASGLSSPNGFSIATDGMIAHLEATMRRSGYHGYVVRTSLPVSFFASRLVLKLFMYR